MEAHRYAEESDSRWFPGAERLGTQDGPPSGELPRVPAQRFPYDNGGDVQPWSSLHPGLAELEAGDTGVRSALAALHFPLGLDDPSRPVSPDSPRSGYAPFGEAPGANHDLLSPPGDPTAVPGFGVAGSDETGRDSDPLAGLRLPGDDPLRPGPDPLLGGADLLGPRGSDPNRSEGNLGLADSGPSAPPQVGGGYAPDPGEAGPDGAGGRAETENSGEIPVFPVVDGPTGLLPPVQRARQGVGGSRAVAPDGVYRTQRPPLAIAVIVGVAALAVPALRLFVEATFAEVPSAREVVPACLLLLGLSLTGLGLYALVGGGRTVGRASWLRPPVGYLLVGLALLVISALAVR